MKDLRISVIDRCNFRCPYCMPKQTYGESYRFLGSDKYLNFDEIDRLVRIFVDEGVRKIRLTGGEPLLRPNLFHLISKLSKIPQIEDLALTTNGYLLLEQAESLRRSGLQRVTVSLDSSDPQVFKQMNGLGLSLDKVLNGIDHAFQLGFNPIKLNAVVQKGINDHTVIKLIKDFIDRPISIRFIEYMDVGNLNGWDHSLVVSTVELKKIIEEEFQLKFISPAYKGEVASRYQIMGKPLEIGFVSSISQPFCRDCSRLRISTDGKLFTCLFASTGTDLREALREGKSDGELQKIIRNIWHKREDRYSEKRVADRKPFDYGLKKIEMYQIGG